jgi:hypothetical protein
MGRGFSRVPAQRGPLRRLADWWHLRRGRLDRILARFNPFGGPDDAGGAGVREPRRPKQPSLSGAVALDEPRDDDRD